MEEGALLFRNSAGNLSAVLARQRTSPLGSLRRAFFGNRRRPGTIGFDYSRRILQVNLGESMRHWRSGLRVSMLACLALLTLGASSALAAPVIAFNPAGDVYTDQTTSRNVQFSITDGSYPIDDATVVCSFDGAAFSACTSYTTGTDSGSKSTGVMTTGDHTVSVRVANTNGDQTTATQNIFVQRTLEQGVIQVHVTPSTTRAGRHPDLLIDVRNTTGQDVGSIVMKLPNGFAGSLAAVNATPKCDFPTVGLLSTVSTNDLTELDAWCDQSKREASVIGNAFIEATVDNSTTRLYGDVLMTKSSTQSYGGSPAQAVGLVLLTHAKISDLDLGYVLIAGNGVVRPLSTATTSDLNSNPVGVDVVFANIPNSITSAHGTTNFTLERSRIWMRSDVDADHPVPLLTNPSQCSTSVFDTTLVTHEGSTHIQRPSQTTTDCADQPFGASMSMQFIEPINPASPPVSYPDVNTFTPLASPPNRGDIVGLRSVLQMDPGSTTIRKAQIDLPGSFVPYYDAIGSAPINLCVNGSTGVQQTPPNCDADGSKIGTFSVKTPLLESELEGVVYKVDSGGALPYLYLYLNDTVLGIQIRIRGKAVPFAEPHNNIRMTLNTDPSGTWRDTPDLPVEKLTLNLLGSIDKGSIVAISGAADVCANQDTGTFRLEGWNGEVEASTFPVTVADCVGPLEFTASPDFAGMNSSGAGGVTSDTNPTLNFAVSGASTTPTYECSLDPPGGATGSGSIPDYYLPFGTSSTTSYAYVDNTIDSDCPIDGDTASYTPSAPLRDGIHTLAIRASSDLGTQERHIEFEVDTSSAADTTGPAVTIDSGPTGTITNSLPATTQFAFHSSGGATDFQCRMDSREAFQPCGTNLTSSSFTPDKVFNGAHTFEVRGEDSIGNVGAAVSRSFTLEPPFAPKFTATPSTTQARAHPTLDVEVTSDSDEDLKWLSFKMPRGFVGSLLGAAQQCSAAAAAANSCPVASKVGTVDATAQADYSDVVQRGDVFLTEALRPGDTAGILVKIDPSVGAIGVPDNVDPIGVRAGLKVRGNAEGVDAEPIDEVPKQIEVFTDDRSSSDIVEFHFRKMTLNLTGGAGASQPLLTNPSDCSPSSWDGAFTSWNSTSTISAQSFQATNCDSLPFYTAFTANVEKLDAAGNPTGKVPGAGDTTRFTGTIAASPDDSGVKFARLELPKSLTASVVGLPLGCSAAVYEATKTCDKGDSAVIGSATATTPLLPGPVTGKVYLGQPKPNNPIEPGYDETLRIIIQLRGLISVDLVGRTTLKNYQTITVFENIPDAPVSSFNVTVDRLVRVQPTACGSTLPYRTITGYNLAYNNKTSNYNSDVNIDCASGVTVKASIRGRGKKAKASIVAKATGGAKFRSLQLTLPRGLKPIKKAIKRKVYVIADGRKMRRCHRLSRNREKIMVTLCHRKAKKVEIRFNRGSLYMRKRLKTATFTLRSKFDNGRTLTQKIKLSGKSLRGTAAGSLPR